MENIPRILPEGASIRIDQKSWPKPSIFTFIQKEGEISDEEMYRTFNMGIGMVLILPDQESEKILEELRLINYDSWLIGEVIKGNKQIVIL